MEIKEQFNILFKKVTFKIKKILLIIKDNFLKKRQVQEVF